LRKRVKKYEFNKTILSIFLRLLIWVNTGRAIERNKILNFSKSNIA
jgi:hypothetical protein